MIDSYDFQNAFVSCDQHYWMLLSCAAEKCLPWANTWIGEGSLLGDSLTAGVQHQAETSYPTILSHLTGVSVYNAGIPKETAAQVAARMIRAPQQQPDDVSIIWVGRNGYEDKDAILSGVAQMVATLKPPRRFLILSILNSQRAFRGRKEYRAIMDDNAALRSRYPSNFVDVRAALVNSGDRRNPVDAASRVLDVIPPRFHADAVHLNSHGNEIVAREVYTRLATLH